MSRRSANEDAVLAKHGFTLGAELGEGTYSKVKHCTWQKPGESASKHIAIKGTSKIYILKISDFVHCKKLNISVINKKTAPKDFLEKFLPRELDIIRKITHPNIVQTYEIITINHKVFIALEWAGRGDLLAYVRLKGKFQLYIKGGVLGTSNCRNHKMLWNLEFRYILIIIFRSDKGARVSAVI